MAARLGKEQFENAILEVRNLHIIAGLAPLINFRTEITSNDEFMSRGGTDDATQKHFIQLLIRCDRTRRDVTHNPSDETLGDLIAKALDADVKIEVGEKPFGGDEIQNLSGPLVPIPYRLDGSDVNLPLLSQLKESFIFSDGMLLLGAVDRAILNWTRLASKDRSQFITRFDSFRIYGNYQQILGYCRRYLGDVNRIDIVQVLPSQEPMGPQASPNLAIEEGRAIT